MKRIFYLYLIWQIIYIPYVVLKIKDYLYEYPNWRTRWLLFAWRFIFPGYGYTRNNNFIMGTNGWGVSWYLIALLMGLPIFCLVLKYVHNLYLIGLGCVALEVLYICSSGYYFATHFYFWGILTFLRLFIYLFVGLVISQHLDRIRNLRLSRVLLLSFVLVIVFLLENVMIYKLSGNLVSEEVISTVPTSTMVTVLAFRWNPQWRTILVRNFSTFLYTSQMVYLTILNDLVKWPSFWNGYFKLIITVVLSLLCFIVYLWIRQRTKWHWLYYMV